MRQQNAEAQEERACLSAIFKLKAEPEKESRATLVAAYDDVAAIFYFGRMMSGYWARNGKTIVTAIGEAFEQKEELSRRCREFDQLLQKDTETSLHQQLHLPFKVPPLCSLRQKGGFAVCHEHLLHYYSGNPFISKINVNYIWYNYF